MKKKWTEIKSNERKIITPEYLFTFPKDAWEELKTCHCQEYRELLEGILKIVKDKHGTDFTYNLDGVEYNENYCAEIPLLVKDIQQIAITLRETK